LQLFLPALSLFFSFFFSPPSPLCFLFFFPFVMRQFEYLNRRCASERPSPALPLPPFLFFFFSPLSFVLSSPVKGREGESAEVEGLTSFFSFLFFFFLFLFFLFLSSRYFGELLFLFRKKKERYILILIIVVVERDSSRMVSFSFLFSFLLSPPPFLTPSTGLFPFSE